MFEMKNILYGVKNRLYSVEEKIRGLAGIAIEKITVFKLGKFVALKYILEVFIKSVTSVSALRN